MIKKKYQHDSNTQIINSTFNEQANVGEAKKLKTNLDPIKFFKWEPLKFQDKDLVVEMLVSGWNRFENFELLTFKFLNMFGCSSYNSTNSVRHSSPLENNILKFELFGYIFFNLNEYKGLTSSSLASC